MLTGLRGVGKTVLLNALRSAAVRAHWGTGKPRGAAGPRGRWRRRCMAVREPGHPRPDEVAQVLGVVAASAQRDGGGGGGARSGGGSGAYPVAALGGFGTGGASHRRAGGLRAGRLR